MYIPSHNCFRKDLIIASTTNRETNTDHYSIKDPNSGEIFEFGEEEYFLCQSMDGTSTPSQIISNFKNSFGLSLAEEDFNDFSRQIAEFGLLEKIQDKVLFPVAASLEEKQDILPEPNLDLKPITKKSLKTDSPQYQKQPKIGPTYIWPISHPGSKFSFLASILRPLSLFFKLLVWGLIPGLPLAFFTFFNNQSIFWQSIALSVEPLPYVTTYIFNVIFVSLTAKLAQGIICAYYGGTIKKFGLVLAAGFFPRFYCDREGIWELNRQQQLWTFATPLLARLIYFVLGVLIWYWTHSTGTNLGTWALLLAHASFLDFLLDACPLLPVDGYFFTVIYFRLPPNFLGRVYLVWDMVLHRRPLPQSLSFREKLGLLLYGPAAVLFWLSMVILIAYSIAHGLADNFPGIFGRATPAILICVLMAAALRQPITFFLRKKGKKSLARESSTVETTLLEREPVISKKKFKAWRKKGIRLLILVGLCVLLFLPYPYRPGGQIQLLPPTQQAIQSQVEGKIIKVMFTGGNGQWIKAGTLVAVMEAIDIENDVLTQQEQIKNQEALVAKQQANLNKLLATPRKEDVEVARQQVEVAKQDVEVARQQIEVAKQDVELAKKKLDTAISKADFSTREASRFQELYKGDVVSRQAYEDKQKEANTERLNVEENRQEVASKQKEVASNQNQLATKQQTVVEKQANLKLVLSGPYPDEIQAARKELEAARAALQRQQQQLKYNQEQLRRTQLLMPIDGRLVTSYLDQKVGSYLKKGETFAVAEDNRHVRGEVRVAEYNVGEFALGASAEVKLLAYPDRPFIGKVISIEPAASAENSPSTTVKAPTSKISDRFVRVIVDIPNAEKMLKSSMTGYAKIAGSTKPAIVAFTRPIVRFIQVEVWSWLP
jgi:multidrug efflux pump subunit AcrA (membrane-fusion protein)